jgi:hypothetical protein
LTRGKERKEKREKKRKNVIETIFLIFYKQKHNCQAKGLALASITKINANKK